MPERRPFPPSPRRRALARAAGLTAASPLLVAAAALGAGAAACAFLARNAADTLGAWLAAACDGHASLSAVALPRAVGSLAAPLVGFAAVAAIAAHVAQTRGLWLPRRRIDGAPAVPRRRGLVDLLGAIVVGATAFGWLWLTAPRLAALVTAPPAQAAIAIAAFVATLAIAIVALGTLDALLRHAALTGALAMTAEEKRQDDRLAAADPRWLARRRELARADARGPREQIAGASLLLVGDDVAVAIAYDPIRQPQPTRVAAGTGPAATQLLAHARRQTLPIHRDPQLATTLAAAPHARIDEAHWPRLAEIVAAVRRR